MKKKTVFTGSAVAIITPFNSNGVDYDAFGRLIDRQIAGGTQAIVVCGTTGEPATMTAQERASVIEYCIKRVAKRIPVIVGTGSNCTADAVANSVNAQKMGADALLVVTPFYNKCTQNGIVAHYKAVSDAVDLPVIAYNVPGRTGVNITPATLKQLAAIKNIVAIKEASGNMDQIVAMLAACKDEIDIYSGDDALTVAMMSMGAKGVISVSANLIPQDVQNMCANALNGNFAAATALQLKAYPLIKALFSEVSPIPAKTASEAMGLCSATVRLPLTPMEENTKAALLDAMRTYGIKC